MTALSSIAGLDDAFLKRLADWLVVLIAITLPWSTSATAICIVTWLIAALPTLRALSGCSHRAEGRINSRGSNRRWMKVQWLVSARTIP
jgi:hypothetical protein